MDAITFRVTPTPGSQRPLSEVRAALWERLSQFLHFYTDDGPLTALLVEAHGHGHEGADSVTLSVHDDDDGDEAARAAAWIRLCCAANLPVLESAASERGWWLAEPRTNLPEVLEAELDAGLDEDDRLVRMLAPADDFIHGLVEAIHTEAPVEHVRSAIWYCGNTAAPPLDALDAILTTAQEMRQPDILSATLDALERLAPRLDLYPLAAPRLDADDLYARAISAALIPDALGRGHVDAERALERLLDGLQLGGPAAEVCAEQLSCLPKGTEHQLRHITEGLMGFVRSGPQGEALHNAVLSLVNLYLNREAIAPGLIGLMREQSDASGHVGGLAQWAIQAFDGRPELTGWELN